MGNWDWYYIGGSLLGMEKLWRFDNRYVCFLCQDVFYKYVGEYHCWLQMNTTLMIGQFVPIVILAILTLTLVEAAGAAEYRFFTTRMFCF